MFLQGPYFSEEEALGLPKAKSWWEHWKYETLNLARILIAFLIVKTINIMLFPQFQGKRVPDLGSAEHEGALVLSCPG